MDARLGGGNRGSAEVLSHALFESLDMDALRARTLESPLVTLIGGHSSKQEAPPTEQDAADAASCLKWAAPGDKDEHGAIFSLF